MDVGVANDAWVAVEGGFPEQEVRIITIITTSSVECLYISWLFILYTSNTRIKG
jgi:hypothetical protein